MRAGTQAAVPVSDVLPTKPPPTRNAAFALCATQVFFRCLILEVALVGDSLFLCSNYVHLKHGRLTGVLRRIKHYVASQSSRCTSIGDIVQLSFVVGMSLFLSMYIATLQVCDPHYPLHCLPRAVGLFTSEVTIAVNPKPNFLGADLKWRNGLICCDQSSDVYIKLSSETAREIFAGMVKV